MRALVTFSSRTFSVLIFTALLGLPKFVVPNLPDLMIKTRRTSGDWQSPVKTMLYVKGARQRTETVIEERAQTDGIGATIQQCDERRGFQLNERDKLYAPFKIEDWSERLKKSGPVPLTHMSGAEVTVTIDSIDTGERRQFQHYTARHITVKTRVEPSPGASTPASVEETDGWYIDLPGLGCQGQTLGVGFVRVTVQTTNFATLGSANRQDRLQIKWLGKAPRGYPIEVTTLTTEAGNKTISKVELLEISEAPLNSSLFDLPAGYRLALQTGNGGADLTKPDTVSNRAEYYWARFTYWMHGFFR